MNSTISNRHFGIDLRTSRRNKGYLRKWCGNRLRYDYRHKTFYLKKRPITTMGTDGLGRINLFPVFFSRTSGGDHLHDPTMHTTAHWHTIWAEITRRIVLF